MAKRKTRKETPRKGCKNILKNQCTSIYKKYGLTKVILFGSVSKSHVSSQSDVAIYCYIVVDRG